jgi:predicted transcriptional regulator
MASHRFEKKYDKQDILDVLSSGEELRTLTILKRLVEMKPEVYIKKDHEELKVVSKDWVRKTLGEFLEAGLVEKVKREDDSADYWKIKNE